MPPRDLIRENSWMFDQVPTAEEIDDLLKTVPAWNGSSKTMAEANYQGYVISIKQMTGSQDNRKSVWRLYTTVAGKIQILRDAHRKDDGSIVPIEETVELEFRGNMVIVKGTMTSPLYGTVFDVGTGISGEGASGADKTNPIENAMTSWRGRAASSLCAAGLLPYTGIASAEEITTSQHREAMSDRGFNVVTAPPKSAPNPELDEKKKADFITKFRGVQSTNKLSDAEFESTLSAFLKSIDVDFEGTGCDFVEASGDFRLLNDLLKYIRESKLS